VSPRIGNNGNHRKKRAISIDGNILTNARMKAGYSLSDAANLLNCNASTLSRWERSLYVPPAEMIVKMMTLYKADYRVIAGGEK
jgi:predicted transcriptional regulator